MLKSGTPVIYTMPKYSTHPGPRAQSVHPAPRGDTYNYIVNKLWVVIEVLEDDKIRVQTRRGKTHVLDATDPKLRPARWWERLVYRHRFPKVADSRI